jgi:lipopolysaccharide transport system permease protein
MNDVTIIKPKKTLSMEDFREIWRYRELLYFFTWRDLKVRYKQTIIGAAWALFMPFITMIVFSVFFGSLAHIPSDGVPYPIFVYVGLLFWQFFSGSLSDVSATLIGNQAIITKVYFPRLILPISACITQFVDFAIGAAMLVVIMAYYHFLPHALGLLIIPILVIISFMAALGLGLFLSAINVKYRDVRYVLPFFIQMLLFVTPVIYSASIAGKYSWILAINPMTGVIQVARAAILGTAPINWLLLAISFLICMAGVIIGVVYFKKVERYFADIV